MKYLRWLLLPFSLIYGLVVLLRNWFYDAGLFKSREFNLPVISIGNLEIGGAGKSPMTEYLVHLLKADNKLATLSRGYGRNTKGFITATTDSTATEIGDEPAQFKHKFPEVTIAVCEDRVAGIEQLKTAHNLIILDDAYQHRSVKPGLNILLFDYNKLFYPRFVLPAGNLREPFSGKWRADILVITKCPPTLSETEKTKCYYRVNPQSWQPLFFTSIKYLPLQDMLGHNVGYNIDTDTTVFLLTGIANSQPLVNRLKTATQHIIHHNYPDHHRFTLKNIAKLAAEFAACSAQKKVIITTEKDAQRLGVHELLPHVSRLFVLVMPIGIEFLGDAQQSFDKLVTDYVRKYSE